MSELATAATTTVPGPSCPRHPGAPTAGTCARCGGSFCAACLAASEKGALCELCRVARPAPARRGSAVAGPLLFFVALVAVVALVALVAVPSLAHARKRANERAAVTFLQALASAETQFATGPGGRGRFGSMTELAAAGVIDADADLLGRAARGYRFEAKASTTTPLTAWWATARPDKPGKTGDHVYFINQLGVVFECPYAGGEHEPADPDAATGELPKGLAPVLASPFH